MLRFGTPPKYKSELFLEKTDKHLPEVLNLSTRYALLHTIAKGGRSLILACKDLYLNRVVAYKTLRSEFKDDEIEVTRLLREARVLAVLRHPNIIPIHDLGRDNQNNYFFTMKLVHGLTLREILDRREEYSLRKLIDIVTKVAFALAHAHAHHVAHRDIKPENILVGSFGEVLLLDWGLAKVWEREGNGSIEVANDTEIKTEKSMTMSGKLQGTLCYMSPEQVQRDPNINCSTDIYSIGVILYEVLFGRVPFDSEKTHEILEFITNVEPQIPEDSQHLAVPKGLKELCLKCMSKTPKSRPKNMDEFISLLKA